MSHPGVAIDPSAASAEFRAVASVLGAPVATVGAGADPATSAGLTSLGAMALKHDMLHMTVTADQAAAGSAGARTVGGYVTTESQNKEALSGTETIAV